MSLNYGFFCWSSCTSWWENDNDVFLTDVTGPTMRASDIFPLINGLTTEIICRTTIFDVHTELTWDCLGLSPLPTYVVDCKTYISKLEYRASITDNGALCKCSTRMNEFVSTAEIEFKIQSKF